MDSETPTSGPQLLGTPRQAALIIALAIAALAAILVALVAAGSLITSDPDPDPTTSSSSSSSSSSSTTSTTDPDIIVSEQIGFNPAGLTTIDEFADMSAAELANAGSGPYGPFTDDRWTNTAPAATPTHPQGQFRISCAPAFWAPDDPILFPAQPGASHLHMFFGNTTVNAATNAEQLANVGGSTCQAGELNRSSYWIPAMLDADENIVVPEIITIYYKSHRPQDVQPLPVGLEMIAGNLDNNANPLPGFDAREWIHWGCDNGSKAVNIRGTIPGADGTPGCPDSQRIQLTIQFGQCLQIDGNGNPVLSSDNHLDHMHMLRTERFGTQNDACPASHPYRIPQISYLIKWANPAGTGETGWHLSSDELGPFGTYRNPGGSAHGDWLGGWNDGAVRAWTDGCFGTARNCSLGLTGITGRQFKRLVGTLERNDEYTGPQVIDCGGCGRP